VQFCQLSGIVVITAEKVHWSTSATATERMLDKPLSLGDRLRFEFGVDALDDKKSGGQSTFYKLILTVI